MVSKAKPLRQSDYRPLIAIGICLLMIAAAMRWLYVDKRTEQVELQDAGLETRRYAKPTFTRPAPPDLLGRIAAECDLVVEALAD